MRAPWDATAQSTDVEELMRRVPGLTRREALRVQQLGLTPDEEVDFAYIAVNIGLDLFYEANQAYVARQVVTNSKGEKVEVLWPSATYDEMTMMVYGNAPVWEMHENPWILFQVSCRSESTLITICRFLSPGSNMRQMPVSTIL